MATPTDIRLVDGVGRTTIFTPTHAGDVVIYKTRFFERTEESDAEGRPIFRLKNYSPMPLREGEWR